MSVKSEVILPVRPIPPVKFPKIYQGTGTGTVVLFTSLHTGTVLKQGTFSPEIGQRDTDWTACTDTTVWAPVPVGFSILLIQE